MAKFDHNAPYGTCHGSDTAAAFYQNGHHFDVNHNHIDLATGKIIEPAAGTPLKRKPVKAEKPAPAPVTPPVTEEPEEDEDNGEGEGDNVDNVGGDGADGDKDAPTEVSEGIDLIAFAQGSGKAQWFAVKKAMASAGYQPEDMANAVSARAAIKAKHKLEA